MQIAEGNNFARDRLIKLYMRSVLKIALSMTKQYELDIEDAISSGCIGLMNAVDRYDPSGFSAFHSYASLWIQQSIQRDCNPVWIDYYYPAHYKEKMFRSIQKYEQYTTGEEPGTPLYNTIIKKIAQETDIQESDVSSALRSACAQKYGKRNIDDLIEQEIADGEMLPRALIIDDEVLFEDFIRNELSIAIDKALSTLTEREASIIRKRNGLDTNRPMTLEEKTVCIWLSRKESSEYKNEKSPILTPLFEGYRKRAYHIAVFMSGSGDLYDSMLGLLLYNRRKMAEKELGVQWPRSRG